VRTQGVGRGDSCVDVCSHVCNYSASNYSILAVRHYLRGEVELLGRESRVMQKANFKVQGVKSPIISLVWVLALRVNLKCCVSNRNCFFVHKRSGVESKHSSWVGYQCWWRDCWWNDWDAIAASKTEATIDTLSTKSDSIIW
jgi:hypothetical protein